MLDKLQQLDRFLPTPSAEVTIFSVSINLLIAAALAYILGRVYMRYGTSLSNRRAFAANFVLLACTTMLIITVVKSSLALSLGLVGALSIVRFRSAIKEPEELAYLFLNIAIGLGLGADQTMITIVAFAIIVGLVAMRGMRRTKPSQNLYLTIQSKNPADALLDQIVGVLQKTCQTANLRRFDARPDQLEASFLVEFEGFESLGATRTALNQLNQSMEISFVDHRGIL